MTGDSSGTSSSLDYAIVKYSNAGVPLWTNRYNGPGNHNDEATAIAVDSSGNVFVTGYSYDSSLTYSSYATVKYSSAGVPLWTRRYAGPRTAGTSGDFAYAVAVDSSGNAFITGTSGNGSATMAYSSAGVPLWTNRFNGNLYKMAVDRAGKVFGTGSSYNGTNYDYVTIKYSSSVSPPRLDFQRLNNQRVLNWTNAGFNLRRP